MTNASGRAVSALVQHLHMRRIIMAYAAASALVAVLAVIHAGILAGMCAIAAPLLMCVAAGGARAIFFWGDWKQKLFGSLAILLTGALAARLAPGFSIALFGHTIGGPGWTVIGGVLGLLASRRANWDA